MTFLHSVIEFQPLPHASAPLPEPRAPEEVLSLLSQEAPQGEYSVDAF